MCHLADQVRYWRAQKPDITHCNIKDMMRSAALGGKDAYEALEYMARGPHPHDRFDANKQTRDEAKLALDFVKAFRGE